MWVALIARAPATYNQLTIHMIGIEERTVRGKKQRWEQRMLFGGRDCLCGLLRAWFNLPKQRGRLEGSGTNQGPSVALVSVLHPKLKHLSRELSDKVKQYCNVIKMNILKNALLICDDVRCAQLLLRSAEVSLAKNPAVVG